MCTLRASEYTHSNLLGIIAVVDGCNRPRLKTYHTGNFPSIRPFLYLLPWSTKHGFICRAYDVCLGLSLALDFCCILRNRISLFLLLNVISVKRLAAFGFCHCFASFRSYSFFVLILIDTLCQEGEFPLVVDNIVLNPPPPIHKNSKGNPFRKHFQ